MLIVYGNFRPNLYKRYRPRMHNNIFVKMLRKIPLILKIKRIVQLLSTTYLRVKEKNTFLKTFHNFVTIQMCLKSYKRLWNKKKTFINYFI